VNRPPNGQCLNGGLCWLEVNVIAVRPALAFRLPTVRRPHDTPIWKLEAALKCRSCKKGRSAPPVHIIKLTETREIAPYVWVHPDQDR
jgi:hypothetical protein